MRCGPPAGRWGVVWSNPHKFSTDWSQAYMVQKQMNYSHEETMKKISVVNLDKLLDNFSEIEKKVAKINEANNLLVLQLEKCNRLLTLSQSKEESIKEECITLQNVIKGLTQTIQNQCNMKDENDKLKGTIHILEEKLTACEQEYKDQIEKLRTEIKNKEEDHKSEIIQLNCDISEKFKVKEVEYKEQIEKKELEILELSRQLKIQNEEKQNEIIKLQIEFNAKLAKVQTKITKSFSDASALPQSIYRRKLQHLQEEKNKEMEILRNTIRDLEQRLNKGQDMQFNWRRF